MKIEKQFQNYFIYTDAGQPLYVPLEDKPVYYIPGSYLPCLPTNSATDIGLMLGTSLLRVSIVYYNYNYKSANCILFDKRSATSTGLFCHWLTELEMIRWKSSKLTTCTFVGWASWGQMFVVLLLGYSGGKHILRCPNWLAMQSW